MELGTPPPDTTRHMPARKRDPKTPSRGERPERAKTRVRDAMPRAPSGVTPTTPVTTVGLAPRQDTPGTGGAHKARPHVLTHPALRDTAAAASVQRRPGPTTPPRLPCPFEAEPPGRRHGRRRQHVLIAATVPAVDAKRTLDSHTSVVAKKPVPGPRLREEAPGRPAVTTTRVPRAPQTAPWPQGLKGRAPNITRPLEGPLVGVGAVIVMGAARGTVGATEAGGRAVVAATLIQRLELRRL